MIRFFIKKFIDISKLLLSVKIKRGSTALISDL